MKLAKKRKLPYITKLILKLAPKAGVKVVLEPEWGFAGRLIYPNGVIRLFRGHIIDMNHLGSSSIAKDKDYAKFFMAQKGYNVAEGQTVFEDSWAETVKSSRDIFYASTYAERLGYPVIVKPNSKSQGIGVTLVSNKKELTDALRDIFKEDRVAIIERYLPGKDYRVVVLDGKIISAYERTPLSVIGDGRNSILYLLEKKQKSFISLDRDTKLDFDDKRIKVKLKKQGFTLKSILQKDQKIFLLDNANLSAGGESIDITGIIHSGFQKLAINLTRDMGLRFAGVDIMVTKGDITESPKKDNHYIIEINSAPGLGHYITSGSKQKKIVEDMYLKVLKAMGKKD